jgi:8-oxo-dGTP pyrophosphatase MutT (NUDIX family)
MNSKKHIFCNNCGKLGHLFHQCKVPITSIGIIAIRSNKNHKKSNNDNIVNDIEVLLIRRKDSLSFVDFMRGKYSIDNKHYIINLLNNMTVQEKKFLLENNFNTIWEYLWNYNTNNLYKNEEKLSKVKFDTLKQGYNNKDDLYDLNDLIQLCNNSYDEPEWGFPKGRRNYQEKDIMCGLREFEEETGYIKNDLNIINNILPFEEIFTGSNYKSYKHKYFMGIINNNIEPTNNFQIYEINKIEWVNINEVKDYIRDYNIEKKKIINELNKLLETYKLYI